MLKRYGYVRVSATVPSLKVANVKYNTDEIIKEIKKLDKKGVQIATFPELCLTGYTCADLFRHNLILEQTLKSIERIKKETKNLNIISIVGAPLRVDNQLFNTAIVITKGKILGIVPKTYIPNYKEFYEMRWFRSSLDNNCKTTKLFGEDIPFGTDLLFRDSNDSKFTFGIEICEDLWCPNAPNIDASLAGATLIFNLSASNEVIGKYNYRKNLISTTAAKNICAYIYASSGVNESTTDLLFSGYSAIYENGVCLIENDRFNFNTNSIIQDIDVARIMSDRITDISYMEVSHNRQYRYIDIELEDKNNKLLRKYKKYPFVPSNSHKTERCEEIINIQSYALAKRLKHTNIKKCVLGISGGLDSTLAFLYIRKVRLGFY